MNPNPRRWHRMLGLSLGGMIALWCLSGALLLWQPLLYPEVPDRSGDARYSLSTVLAAARRLYPADSGSWRIDIPEHTNQPVRIRYVANDPFLGPEAPVTIWVEPRRGVVMAVTEGRDPFLAACYRLHTALLLPDFRPVLLVLPATLLTVLMLTGLLQRRSRSRPSWHRRIALVTLPGLTISLVTGLGLIAPQSWWPEPGETSSPTTRIPAGSRAVSLDAAVAHTRRALPDAELRRVQLPGEPGRPWTLYFHVPATLDIEPAWIRVHFDPWNDRVLGIGSGRGHLRQWLYLIHSGAVLEPFCRTVLLLGGAGPLLLAITGLTRWYRRYRHKRYGIPAAQNSA